MSPAGIISHNASLCSTVFYCSRVMRVYATVIVTHIAHGIDVIRTN